MTANGRKKKENAADAKVFDLIPIRRISFLFGDPDGTDSSGDEDDDRLAINRGVKRTVHEIDIFPLHPASSSPRASTSKNAQIVKRRRRVPLSTSAAADSGRYKGVRQRRWGKWAAEIRDSIRGIRRWLGTYATKEEAAAAYQEASRQLQDEKLRLQLSSCQPPVSSASSSITVSDRTLSLPSPSSVLDVSAAAAASVQAPPPPPPPPPPPTRKPMDAFWPPAVDDFLEERSIAELFEDSALHIPPEFDFAVAGDDGNALHLGDNFDGINDLPLWAPDFDGDDLSFLD